MILSKKNKVVFIPVSELRPNPMQSRASFDGDSLAALTESNTAFYSRSALRRKAKFRQS